MLMKDGVAHVQSGGGIVYDSDPAAEYAETENKAMALIGRSSRRNRRRRRARRARWVTNMKYAIKLRTATLRLSSRRQIGWRGVGEVDG